LNETSHVARPADAAVVARTAAELAELSRMTGAQMAEKYLALYGQPAHSRNKDFLRKRSPGASRSWPREASPRGPSPVSRSSVRTP
jgi:hypothetical protein